MYDRFNNKHHHEICCFFEIMSQTTNNCDSSQEYSEVSGTFMHFCMESIIYTFNNYIDVHYFRWLLWVFYPLIVTLLLPAGLLLLVYASALFLHVYRIRHLWVHAVSQDFWRGGRRIICALWEAQSKIWHGKLSYF